MVVNTWLVLLFLSIHATFVGGRYYKAQGLERQVPSHGSGPTTIEHICLDELNYSDIFYIPQACLDFAKWASQNCHRTCDICQGGPTTTSPLCASFDIPKACLDFPKWASESCRFTCKVCTE